MKVDRDLLERYRAMRNAGGWVGHTAECRIALARADRWLESSGLETVTEDDPEPWEGDCPRPLDVVSVRLVRPCPLHGIECRHAETVAAIGGVGLDGNTRADREYLRILAAELASEVMP